MDKIIVDKEVAYFKIGNAMYAYNSTTDSVSKFVLGSFFNKENNKYYGTFDNTGRWNTHFCLYEGNACSIDASRNITPQFNIYRNWLGFLPLDYGFKHSDAPRRPIPFTIFDLNKSKINYDLLLSPEGNLEFIVLENSVLSIYALKDSSLDKGAWEIKEAHCFPLADASFVAYYSSDGSLELMANGNTRIYKLNNSYVLDQTSIDSQRKTLVFDQSTNTSSFINEVLIFASDSYIDKKQLKNSLMNLWK